MRVADNKTAVAIHACGRSGNAQTTEKVDRKNEADGSNITSTEKQPNTENYVAQKGEDKVIGEKSGNIGVDRSIRHNKKSPKHTMILS